MTFSTLLQPAFNQPDEFVIFARKPGVEYRGDEHWQGGKLSLREDMFINFVRN